MRRLLPSLLFGLAVQFAWQAAVATDELDWRQLWLAKTGGIWKVRGQEDRYGYYKAFVFREGLEHARDRVLVQITEADPKNGAQRIVRSYWLPAPGVKGYVTDMGFTMLDELRMALSLDIEMKAMDGIVLREVYVLSPDGRHKLVNEAKYADIYDGR